LFTTACCGIGLYGYIYLLAASLRIDPFGLYKLYYSFGGDCKTETTLFDRILFDNLLIACGEFLFG
jgi:hypothetical protein